jgi:4a-hydroxytetrahydrobiopterin dehydratase
VALLADEQIQQQLAGSQWALAETRMRAEGACLPASAGGTIVREYKLADFAAAIALVNRVAELAEAANHHPDILVYGWNKVRLELSTHSEGGLTDADFALASQIDRLD